jgi:hypothetical protein
MRQLILCAVFVAGCGGGDEETGASCEIADDCYDIEDRDQIVGTIECLDRVPEGYCTHTCADDLDCCMVVGECTEENPQVCAPFENDPTLRCFLSCEADVIGDLEENDYCHEFASEGFICRSTGAGAENRKVCVPEG